MESRYPSSTVWQALRSEESHVALRIGVSIAAGLLLAGLSVLAAAVPGVTRGYHTTEEATILALLLASLVWFGVVWLVWRRAPRFHTRIRPILGTIIVGGLTILICAIADEFIRYNEELVMGGCVLCGSALVLLFWSPVLDRLHGGRPVVGADGQVDVHCPECGYSLIGLTELRCPECGTRFTIDELIRAQDYARPRRPQNVVGPPPATVQPAEPARHRQA